MWRTLLLGSVAGKVVAGLLWAYLDWKWPAVVCFFLPDGLILYQIFVPSAQILCPICTHFQTPRTEVWLTIDDGPDPEDTPRILDLLDRFRVRATFFVIGARAARWPQLVAEIVRRGHDVGHHTQTHPVGSFWCASPSRVRAELDDGLAALRRAGADPRWFRAPVGIKNPFLGPALAARGLAGVGWSVRSLDTVSHDPARVVARVLRKVRPGAILLFHEGPGVDPRVRVQALARLLEEFASRRIDCVLPLPKDLRPPLSRHECHSPRRARSE